MTRTTTRLTIQLTIAALCLLQAWTETSVEAGLVSFSNISQSGQGPGDPANPYGAPVILGNSLTFPGPSAFSATSANGLFDIEDGFTDGFLSFSVEADPDTWITGLSLEESGLRSLLELQNPGTATTRVRVIAVGSISVIELDHGNSPLTGLAAQPMGIGFDLTWDLANHMEVVLWNGVDAADIAATLTERGVAFEHGATAIDFFMNNQLLAISEDGTFAFIDKKFIDFDVDTEMVPEPGTIILGIAGMLAVAVIRPWTL